ncbi:hypothetical protein [Streptococcus suis]|uniref:hypothetical protein n=1 Tax=Streptococcus suis TaxID=1307 RepID=UPI001ABDCF99|nr:hypothetical protein [Streptococcus suis]
MNSFFKQFRPRFNKEWYMNECVYTSILYSIAIFYPQGFWSIYSETWFRCLFILLIVINAYLGWFTKIGQKNSLASLLFYLLFDVLLLFMLLQL